MRLTVRSTISCSDRRRLLAPKKHPRSARYGGVGFAVFGATLFVAAGASVAAQAPSPAPGETPLSVVFDRTTVDALPATVNLFSFLETTQADVVTDRFYGGVNGAAAGRLGVFLAPLGQTNFRVGDIDVTSPRRGGPLFVPPVHLWRGLTVTSGLVPSDTSGPGLLVALDPESPSPTWQGSFQASGTAEPLVSTTSRLGSPIARTAGFGSVSGRVRSRGAAPFGIDAARFPVRTRRAVHRLATIRHGVVPGGLHPAQGRCGTRAGIAADRRVSRVPRLLRGCALANT
jgi:hypothetical protein